MNDEVKEILIDLINYYNTMGTENDPGIQTFERVAHRASRALKNDANGQSANKNSADVDPFGTAGAFPAYKLEDEW